MPTSKRYTLGTHRICSPAQTWQWLAAKLPAVGVTRVADVTALDCLGIPVYQAIRPASRNLSVSQGKAMTAMGARVSAAMESVELWHAECLEHLPQVHGSAAELPGGNAIATAALAWRAGFTARGSARLSWVRATAAGDGPHGWLPRQMLELDLMLPETLLVAAFHQSSNGLASGNCLEEAVLHGLCELIERHAIHLARAEPARRVALRQESIEDEGCRSLIEKIRSAGMKLAIYDLSWEAGVPVVLVDLVAADLPNVWHGSGCHPSPRIALSRALTEAAQVRLTYISGARDDLLPLDMQVAPAEVFESYREPPGERDFEGLPDLSSRSVQRDTERLTSRLAGLGYPAYFVDLSREQIGVPVARAFVPGLREAYF